ncbi:hypothetical protein N6L27_00495 [Leisingera sp. SS27]|uniref:hypothetical protein n=1 Tax=Leisingera sp. SS27 TaxID=2979462 RepID=UPI00233035DB|nr:hypothetical protein [Leisingera sp. SS27]MDC0656472.1 hypothetical protein [Leisingera sp. SS27]
MFRFGISASAAALAFAASLAFAAPAAALETGNGSARVVTGLVELGFAAKSQDIRKHRRHGYNRGYSPRTYYKPYRGRHYVKRHRHHSRGLHRHRSRGLHRHRARHGGYYRHRH